MKVLLGDYIQEYSCRNKKCEDIPVYSVTNTQGFCSGYFGKEVASKDKSTYKVVPRGYFAYNPTRINVGSVDWQRNEEKVIVSPLYNVFSVSEKLERQYLYYYLKSDITLQYIKTVATGSVRDNLKLSMLYNYKINVPDINAQKAIANRLDMVQRIICQRRREVKLLDELVKARFVEMFGDPVNNPMNWKKERLQNHIEMITGYPFDSGGYSDNGIKICGGLIIMPDGIKWGECKHWPSTDGYEQFLLEPEDIVVALDRPWISGGFKVGMVNRKDLPVLLIQRTARIRGVDMEQKFLFHLLKDKAFECQCMITGSLVPHISNRDINNYEVILPPLELQQQFAAFAAQTDKSKVAIQKSLDEIQFLFDSLMQEYFG